MKSRILQIADGTVLTPKPEVVIVSEQLKETVLPDKTVSVELEFSSKNRVPMHLFLYSTNPRVTVERKLTVSHYGKVTLEIDSKGLAIFDEIRGSIDVIYNGGEQSVPYCFTVGLAGNNKDLTFRTLKEFRTFATERRQDAVMMFSWKEFLLLPFMQDLKMQGLYRTFQSLSNPERGMEEFLKACGSPLKNPFRQDENKAPQILMRRRMEQSDYSREVRRDALLMKAFLDYDVALHREEGVYEAGRSIERAAALYPDSIPATLILAYRYLQDQDLKKARELLLKIQNDVQKNRMEKRSDYALFLYLASIIQGEPEKIDNARKLTRKYFSENTGSLMLSMMEYRMNLDPEEDPKRAADFLRQCYYRGVRQTPVLENTAILYGETSAEPESLTEYELLSVLYGLRHGLISEKKLFRILTLELTNPKLLNLYLQILKLGYLSFKNQEFLYAILSVFLQKRWTGERYFFWYREAVEQKMTIQGMYEGYMLSLPADYSEALPENLVTYFGYRRESESVNPRFLYSNVLAFYRERPEIYSLYQDKIEQFALRSMRLEQYALPMLPLYQTILSREFLNAENAPAMLKLFSLYRVRTSLEKMARVIVYYPELDEEDSYALETADEALVPIFSEEAILAFETRKGERFFDGASSVERCFENEELEKQCLLHTGNSLLLKLRETNEIVKNGVLRENELFVVTDIMKDKRLSPFYRSRLYETLIDLSLTPSMRHVDCSDFLAEADYASFPKEYRLKLLEVFLGSNRDKIALERAVSYGIEGLPDDALLKLAETAMTYPFMEGSDKLLSYCMILFEHDSASAKVLEYLARFYNGTVEDMTAILKSVRRKKASSFDLADRAMMTALYSGRTKELDLLFEYHLADRKRNDALEKAYLVLRSHEYFTAKKRFSETGLHELKQYVLSLPNVCLLALLEYYGTVADTLTEEDRVLLRKLLARSVEENLVLACFSKFEAAVEMPFELENRVYVEYRNPEAKKVSVIGKTFPDQKTFHRDLTEVYPGVFVQSFFLFKREWIQYTLMVYTDNEKPAEIEGAAVLKEERPVKRNGRYEALLMLEKKIQIFS
ncbi:MAG: hypothetical protein J5794_04855, partial [Lachnospiraceae bacterium]|nr:hypothetical protein [Lachnospiraceae bacterium]